MEGETYQIPKDIPIPLHFALTISVEEYLPTIINKHNNYTVFVCKYCGNMAVATLSDSHGHEFRIGCQNLQTIIILI
jgi:hypothetical protein